MASAVVRGLGRWALPRLTTLGSPCTARHAPQTCPQLASLQVTSAAAAAAHFNCRLVSTDRRSYRSASVPAAAVGSVATKDERRAFMSVFPDVVRNLTEVGFHPDLEDANRWFAKVLQYTVQGGKLNRGLAVPLTFRMLVPAERHTEEALRQAHVVGWCVELLQGFFLVLDDIMDGSETRRGKPCWHRQREVGMNAINDGILLEAGIYKLLKLHCADQPYYPALIDLFHNVTMKTALGQTLDLLGSQSDGTVDLSKYTMGRYTAIVKYKTAYYSFALPIHLAMHISGIADVECHRQARAILLEMGHLFQVQDDFLDCFGDPAIMGKVGTDIQDGKCSWLVVAALQRATPSQRALLQENYGRADPACVQRVKALYEQLHLPAVYSKYELNTYDHICRLVEQTSRGMPHKVFYKMLDKIYKRQK